MTREQFLSNTPGNGRHPTGIGLAWILAGDSRTKIAAFLKGKAVFAADKCLLNGKGESLSRIAKPAHLCYHVDTG